MNVVKFPRENFTTCPSIHSFLLYPKKEAKPLTTDYYESKNIDCESVLWWW